MELGLNDEDFSNLVRQVRLWQANGEKVVLCHGCFDPLHIGHLRHFQAAKRSSDRLVVTVTADRHVNKGSNRPIFTQSLRLEMVLALRIVDAAAINPFDSAVETINQIRPYYFAKGSDYLDRSRCNPNFLVEEAQAITIGSKVIYTHEQAFSSSQIIQCLSNSST